MPGVVAHDRRNEPRLLRDERARRPVDAVAQGSRRVPHSLLSPQLTSLLSLSAREAVATETPARSAT